MTTSGTNTASAIAEATSASSLWRRMRRSRPSYSSTGICCVFHERPQSHAQRSPYGTRFISPHSHVIVIGGRGHSLLGGLALGSVAQKLVRCSPISVLVVRHPKVDDQHREVQHQSAP